MRLAKSLPRSKVIVVGLSGRGDKDVQVVARALNGDGGSHS
jgi:tryptophan synthase beta subunit